MTDESVPDDKHDDEAEWRLSLPEVFRPIAQRYGKDKFAVAWHAGAAQEALMLLHKAFGKYPNANTLIMNAAASSNQLAFYAAESQQMTYADVQAIQLDIQQASTLANATRMQAGRIIVPS